MNAVEKARLGPLFALGRVVATPGARDVLSSAGRMWLELLERHATGDFGVVCAEDAAANRRAIGWGGRVSSAYEVEGERIWVITEADRSVTTFLLPSEY